MKLTAIFSSKGLSLEVAANLPKIKESEYDTIRETYPLLKIALRTQEGLDELLKYMQEDFESSFFKGESMSFSTLVFSALLEMGNALREELEK